MTSSEVIFFILMTGVWHL